ncbi:MAG: hypothetical protein ABI612_11860 [Betaproteobacteria bacterium]
MRINQISTLIVTRPEFEGPAEVTPTTPIDPIEPGGYTGGRVVAERPDPVNTPQLVARRPARRRTGERRKNQVPVLMDTRVSQRRTERRRAQDEAPSSVDVEA